MGRWEHFALALVLVACGGDEFGSNPWATAGSGGLGQPDSGAATGGVAGSGSSSGNSGHAGATGGQAGATGGGAGTGGLAGEAGTAGSSAGASGAASAGSAGAGGTGGSAGATGGSGGSAGAAGSSAGGASGSGGSTAPPFTIDPYEVTRGEYETWLATNPSTSGQASKCSWNTVLTPPASCMANEFVCQSSQQNCANHPQVCVDWCDAQAYCEAHGKRLCGRIGGGSNSAMFGNNLDRSQWYYACTSNGAHAYPYGDTYNAYVCSYDNAWGTWEVGKKLGCHSDVDPWDAAYDLSGNVSEWTDECEANTSAWDPCLTRGGSFFTGHDTTRVRCEDDSREIRSHLDYDLGFRCCAD